MSEQLQSIEKRLSVLEKNIEHIADQLKKSGWIRTSPVPQKSEPTTQPKSDSHSASLLLPIVAAICFVLAGVFIVRLAIESGWLTPLRQWSLLTALGFSLAGMGRWLEKIDRNYRSYLSASGIIVLYISTISSSIHFHIVPESVSLIMSMVVSGLCLLLFQFHKSELFPILTSIGTYISPLLLGTKADLLFDASFFLILAFIFSTIATYLRTRTLSLTAAYFGIGVFTLLHARENNPENLMLIISVLIIQFLTFAYGVYDFSVRSKATLSRQMSLSYVPVLLFSYGTIYYFIDRWIPEIAPWISLGLAALTYFLYWNAKRKITTNLQSQEMISAFLCVVLVHSGYLQILPDTAKPWLLPTFLLLGYIGDRRSDFPILAPIVKITILAIGFIEFVKICFHLATEANLLTVVPALITLSLGLFYYFNGSRHIKDQVLLFLSMTHLLAILALYRIAFEYGSLAVSALWGIYSIAILSVGYNKKDPSLAKSSLAVLLISSLKALVYDAVKAPSMVRILSLLITGAILYGSGYLFKKIQRWNSDT